MKKTAALLAVVAITVTGCGSDEKDRSTSSVATNSAITAVFTSTTTTPPPPQPYGEFSATTDEGFTPPMELGPGPWRVSWSFPGRVAAMVQVWEHGAVDVLPVCDHPCTRLADPDVLRNEGGDPVITQSLGTAPGTGHRDFDLVGRFALYITVYLVDEDENVVFDAPVPRWTVKIEPVPPAEAKAAGPGHLIRGQAYSANYPRCPGTAFGELVVKSEKDEVIAVADWGAPVFAGDSNSCTIPFTISVPDAAFYTFEADGIRKTFSRQELEATLRWRVNLFAQG